MIQKKSKNQLLREIQDIVDKFNEKKQIVESMLMEIDDLEKKYNILIEEVKNNK
jgi:predicted nucleic acid-binding OB-fold protein